MGMDTNNPGNAKPGSVLGSIGNNLILNTDNAWGSIDDLLESIDGKLERMADAAELQALLAFDASGMPPLYEGHRDKIADLVLRIMGRD